ncbi:CinA family protein [Hyphobacterium sp. HN65]|uniref:CinA family protein n=1 Tax=Hyphobacterium lacteum TaxID=3116575 RepID=A0ABU7LMU7_9PROT|nr:CinA family protein [Hyphobacterium sp. HN65]MEE2524941.1 CinA family protein [Hyphobacterium sp. HN65]
MNDLESEIAALAVHLVKKAETRRLVLVTAESCTGGMAAAAITRVPGASNVFDRGFITYSNEAKVDLLGVSVESLETHGAVSETVAREMAIGALSASRGNVAVSITGIAGPGGSDHKPAGLVHFGLAAGTDTLLSRVREFGDVGRDEVRQAAVKEALEMLLLGVDRS